MGILKSLYNGLAKQNAELAWDYYQRAKREDPRTLKSVIAEQQNKFIKAAFLLAIAEKDSYSAQEIYNNSQSVYDSTFMNLKQHYRRFEPIVDNFMRKFKSSY